MRATHVDEDEAARPVRDLRVSWHEAPLSDERRLLVARDAAIGTVAPSRLASATRPLEGTIAGAAHARRRTERAARRPSRGPRDRRAWSARRWSRPMTCVVPSVSFQTSQESIVPKASSSCERPERSRIHSSFVAEKYGSRDEARPVPDQVMRELDAALGRPPVLPDDRALHGPPRPAIPDDRRLTLIRDPDRRRSAAGIRAERERPSLPRATLVQISSGSCSTHPAAGSTGGSRDSRDLMRGARRRPRGRSCLSCPGRWREARGRSMPDARGATVGSRRCARSEPLPSTSTGRSPTTSRSSSAVYQRAVRRARQTTHRERVLRHARRSRGGGDHRTWLGVHGDTLAALVEERIDRYLARCRAGETVSAAVRDAVAYAAARVPVAVVSGAFRGRSSRSLAGARLDGHVAVVVAADDVERGKPDPEGYLLALERSAAIAASEAVAFEDTEAGVASAKAAGLRCIAFSARIRPSGSAWRRRAGRGDRCRRSRAVLAVTFVIAHRGACWELPENTLAAFERAIEVGADYVELDVHATSNGTLVVCHDAPLGGELRLEEAVAAHAREDRDHVRAQDAVALSTTRRGAEVRRAPPGRRDRRCRSTREP